MINFKTTKEDMVLIIDISKRAVKNIGYNYQTINMDITACHLNGNPLKLKELLQSDNSDFNHDICGIANNIDRETGKLENCFVPRYSR